MTNGVFLAVRSVLFQYQEGGSIVKKAKKRKEFKSMMRCPVCGSSVVLRSADGIYHTNPNNTKLYVCSRYPECDTYVRTHPGTNIPVGTLANRNLRKLRAEAHKSFDRLYRCGYMTKEDAYHWLASVVDAPLSHAHIGHLGDYYCKRVIQESNLLYKQLSSQKRYPLVSGGTL